MNKMENSRALDADPDAMKTFTPLDMDEFFIILTFRNLLVPTVCAMECDCNVAIGEAADAVIAAMEKLAEKRIEFLRGEGAAARACIGLDCFSECERDFGQEAGSVVEQLGELFFNATGRHPGQAA